VVGSAEAIQSIRLGLGAEGRPGSCIIFRTHPCLYSRQWIIAGGVATVEKAMGHLGQEFFFSQHRVQYKVGEVSDEQRLPGL
jgi:hypothetical protein